MISIEDVTVAYGGFVLLDKINFHVSETDKIGLVGKNGAGKSTILKLICGQQNPTSGRIDRPRDLTVGYLPQIMEHHRGRSVLLAWTSGGSLWLISSRSFRLVRRSISSA